MGTDDAKYDAECSQKKVCVRSAARRSISPLCGAQTSTGPNVKDKAAQDVSPIPAKGKSMKTYPGFAEVPHTTERTADSCTANATGGSQP